jgi:hypothetical protein
MLEKHLVIMRPPPPAHVNHSIILTHNQLAKPGQNFVGFSLKNCPFKKIPVNGKRKAMLTTRLPVSPARPSPVFRAARAEGCPAPAAH